MPAINLLSPHVADLIAAGEVVERPASVIKELIENAFDAGAKNIICEFRGGGMTYIRITDDGCGMLPEDAGVCFLRHATSKLKDEYGLESIGTMGFRGEALAAISSVSRIELLTRKRGTNEGTRMLVEAGDIEEMAPHGCPEGTTMIIHDLFHNTPARLKFMKSDKSEGTACTAAALKCALGRPDVSIRLIKDGQEVFFSPGDGKASSAAYSLLGRETAKEFLECSSDDCDVKVSGFISSPRFGHGNRSKQYFFVNGRCIKTQLLTAAVEQAYKNTLLTGRFPGCVIYLDIPPASVDVNVHPAKTEVKFREERKMFDAVYYAALSALQNENSVSAAPSPATVKKVSAEPKKDFYKTMSATEYRDKYSGSENKYGASKSSYTPSSYASSGKKDLGTITWDRRPVSPSSGALKDGRSLYGLDVDNLPKTAPAPRNTSLFDETPAPVTETHPKEYVSSSMDEIVSAPKPKEYVMEQSESSEILSHASYNVRLIGEAMKTYILAEMNDSLLIIDKHAAHERMIFDRLKTQKREVMSQTLILPITLRMDGEDVEIMEANKEALSSLGFDLEAFGDDAVIIRAVPADTDASDAAAMVEEICETLKKGDISSDTYYDEILHTIACKAAIKAGWNTTNAELMKIVEAVASGEVKYCPHGRPVSITITRKQLDKDFSRIV